MQADNICIAFGWQANVSTMPQQAIPDVPLTNIAMGP